MKDQISRKRRVGGYTLTEALVVIAIMVILFGVAVGGLLTLRKNLRQKELDAKAEIIYVAAQNRLTELRASGFDSLYTPSRADGNMGIYVMNDPPSDVEDSEDSPELYYVTSVERTGTFAAAAILPESAVDKELWDGNWIIEYSPKTGTIYAVFYSQETISRDETDRNLLRFKQNRLKDGAKVGYYGGDVTRTNYTTTLAPSISISNNEKLTVKFYCSSPDSGALSFRITITDQVTKQTFVRPVDQADMDKLGALEYCYTWVLDSLDKNQGFEAQTGIPGGNNITIKLTAKSVSSDTIGEKDCQRTTNSLFADPDFNVSGNPDTAYIAYGRHLQNLSVANESITKAVLVSDISFRDDKTNDEDYYSLYGDSFTPITNDNLTSFSGSYVNDSGETATSIIDGLHIASASGNAGLFGSFGGTMTDVTLTGTRIDGGTNTGALVGRVSGTATLNHCRVFLSSKQGDELDAVAELEDLSPWLLGNTAGGLVGAVTGSLTLKNSMAATVISGKNYAGGLVGTVSGTLAVNGCYSDCYLFAGSTGGIAGGAGKNSAITLEDFYTLGYQAASKYAAGLVPARVASAKNGYTGVEYQPSADGCAVYTTALSGDTVQNVYYLNGEMGEIEPKHMAKTDHATNTDIQDLHKLSASFTMDQAETHPYNLLDQGLTYYSYPRLSGLEHYGDWAADPDQESLVYYEVYQSGNEEVYGFYGANMTTLRSDLPVIGDGYALVTVNKPSENDTISVAYENNDTEKLLGKDAIAVNKNGTSYYLLPLSSKALHTSKDAKGFYERITIGEKSYYYNPYFAKAVALGTEAPNAPQTVYIRTPRHLYDLSVIYGNNYADFVSVTASSTFRQELDLDYAAYHWTDYTTLTQAVTVQEPIGSNRYKFQAAYNGGYHYIHNLSISSTQLYVGLFGYTAKSSSIRNLCLDGNGTGTALTVSHSSSKGGGTVLDGSSDRLYLGVLAGYNEGTIENCAVTGFALAQYGYNNSAMFLGGLVGGNGGSIYDCSADTPAITLSNDKSSSTVGGFVGINSGSISDSYAGGSITVLETKNSTVTVSGFAGDNRSYISRSYAGTALTVSGEAAAYGFAPKGTGYSSQCYYLDAGTYSYCGLLYSFSTSKNDYADTADGKAITGEDLATLNMGRFGTAAVTKLHSKTQAANYPYPAVVRNESGQLIHIGNWASQEKDLGNLGVFYWEYESGGSNSGYHFSYVGTNNGEASAGSSLCVAHNDGGVITEYGYGYFYKKDTVNDGDIKLQADNCVLGKEYKTASAALKKQLPQYSFVAYKTGNMYLTGSDVNSTWKLTYNGNATYTYSVCPFFADSITLLSSAAVNESASGAVPGSKDKPYEIRSVDQLQYINWNYGKKSATTCIDDFNTWLNGTTATGDEYCGQYPYLICSTNKQNTPATLVWNQSHDLNAYDERSSNFTPVGSFRELSTDDSKDGGKNSYPVMAYFAGTYDGGAYAIKNIEINSSAEMVGLFGITVGANMRNIVLYSDRGNTICGNKDAREWYCIGGLVGFAAKGTGTSNVSFTNCTVSGYKILDQRSKSPGWGGGCVGGLVGATNMNITRCTAVTDITLDITYFVGNKNLRAGGLAGVCRGTVDACYAGGSIVSPRKAQSHTLNWGSNTSIWVGGIVGGIVMRNQGDLQNLVGSVTDVVYVKNSYSYVEVPAWSADTWVMGSYSIASNGEMQRNFTLIDNPVIYIVNCYALDTAAAQSEDYKNRYLGIKNIDWSNWNMNAWGRELPDTTPERQNRAIMIRNDRCPYLTYQQMTDSLQGYLNSGFGKVTVSENGAGISGKYSFPGNDSALRNLNYPFPTILTQTDVFGNTVNVHYGSWPKFGLYWNENTGSIDMIQDRTQTASVQSQAQKASEAASAKQTEAEPDSSLEEKAPVAADAVTADVKEAAEPQAQAEPEATAADTAKSAAVSSQEEADSSAELTAAAVSDAASSGTEAGGAYLLRELHVYSASGYRYSNDQVTFSYKDEENNTVEKTASPAVVESCTPQSNCYAVKILAQKPGTIVIEAAITHGGRSYTADLTVTVTASLQLVAGDGKGVSLYEQDAVSLPLTLRDQKGNTVTASDQETITYSVNVQNPNSSEPAASAVYNEATGELDITALTAGSRPEAVVSVTATYTPAWGAAITASTTVTVSVKPSVHLGVTDGTDYNEVSVLHTPKTQTTPDSGKDKDPKKDTLPKVADEKEAVDAKETMWLYATSDYVAPDDLYVEEITLTIGGKKYTLEDQESEEQKIPEGTQYADKDNTYQLDLGSLRTSKDKSFTYRSISLKNLRTGSAPDEQWAIELLVSRRGRDQKPLDQFKLTFKRANTITLMSGTGKDDPGMELTTLRLPQGGSWADIPVDQETLNTTLAASYGQAPEKGQRWIWTLPDVKSVTGNITVYRSSEAIRYQVAFDGNYDGWELDGYEMDPLSLHYGEPGTAPDCKFVRDGYSFQGWAASADGAATYKPDDKLKDLTETHGETITLYAVWQKDDSADQSGKQDDSASSAEASAGQTSEAEASASDSE